MSRTYTYFIALIGVVCVGWYTFDSLRARGFQTYEKRVLADTLKAGHPPLRTPIKWMTKGKIIGRLDIPRIGIDAIVLEGVDAKTLRLGVGHIPGSPLPGQRGNISLAAHRDTFFRALRHIRVYDRIRLTTPRGSSVYEVDWTKIVGPRDIWVLKSGGHNMLTLITCYPFYMVGAAPDRFIVRAHMVS